MVKREARAMRHVYLYTLADPPPKSCSFALHDAGHDPKYITIIM